MIRLSRIPSYVAAIVDCSTAPSEGRFPDSSSVLPPIGGRYVALAIGGARGRIIRVVHIFLPKHIGDTAELVGDGDIASVAPKTVRETEAEAVAFVTLQAIGIQITVC